MIWFAAYVVLGSVAVFFAALELREEGTTDPDATWHAVWMSLMLWPVVLPVVLASRQYRQQQRRGSAK